MRQLRSKDEIITQPLTDTSANILRSTVSA